MAYVIDTNVAIAIRDGDGETIRRLSLLEGAIVMSVVTRVELEGGVYRDPANSAVRRARLDAMLSAIPTLAFDDEAASAYGAILKQAGYSRRKLLDRMIAAHALIHRARLVTTNPGDFQDVPGLEILGW